MIGERIKILRTERNLTQAALAHALGIAKTTLAAYEQDKNEPSNETFIKIANYFNVSADYLLGLTDVKTANANIAFIANYLGLTERSIAELHSYHDIAKKYHNTHMMQKLRILNMFFEPHCELLEHITDYIYFSATHFKKFSDNSNSSLTPISDLELWDDSQKVGYSDDWDMWSKALLLIVEEELMSLREQFHTNKKIASAISKKKLHAVYKPPTTE